MTREQFWADPKLAARARTVCPPGRRDMENVLLPDGFECPSEEWGDELLNALIEAEREYAGQRIVDIPGHEVRGEEW